LDSLLARFGTPKSNAIYGNHFSNWYNSSKFKTHNS
jgi:hypothetical protein